MSAQRKPRKVELVSTFKIPLNEDSSPENMLEHCRAHGQEVVFSENSARLENSTDWKLALKVYPDFVFGYQSV